MIHRVLRITLLFDLYGALLTGRQRECLEMHYLDDLSLAEIAEELGVSRQAVHDMLKRAEAILEEYEARLKLAERLARERETLTKILALLRQIPAASDADGRAAQAAETLEQLLDPAKEA